MSSYGHGDRELHHGLPFSANPTKRRRISSDGNPPPPLISKLGDDLLVEILIRGLLNPRFACRSKLVCKQWSSLISSPCFNRRFVARHQGKEETPPSISSFLPVPGEARRSLWVLDSFEDLLLCGFAGFDRNTNGELGLSYLICNPFTKQWIALPLAPEKPFEQCPEVVARLVCEPRISKNLDLGDGQAAFVYSEYRFRVVCIYTLGMSTMLDVFCSESGEWTEKALVLHGYQEEVRLKPKSCHGKLFWAYAALLHVGIVEFNPFRFDIPPVFIHDDSIFERPATSWGFSVSHGALHLIQLETETTPGCSRNALIVWRLEDDRRSWKRQHEVLLKTMWHGDVPCNIEFDLHPENPETALLILGHYSGRIFSCDLRSGELEQLITTGRACEPGWMLFQPRFSCWPTPIPSYKELRGLYDGSYSCWVQQSSDEAKTPSATEDGLVAAPTQRYQSVDGIEQSGHQRKDNISQLVIDGLGLEQARQEVQDLQSRLENVNRAIVQLQASTVSASTNKDLKLLHKKKRRVSSDLLTATANCEMISRLHQNLPLDPMHISIPGVGELIVPPEDHDEW